MTNITRRLRHDFVNDFAEELNISAGVSLDTRHELNGCLLVLDVCLYVSRVRRFVDKKTNRSKILKVDGKHLLFTIHDALLKAGSEQSTRQWNRLTSCFMYLLGGSISSSSSFRCISATRFERFSLSEVNFSRKVLILSRQK